MLSVSEYIRLIRKAAILGGLVLCIVLAGGSSKVLADCVDYFTCQNTCDYNWTSCRISCQGYPPPDIYSCQDGCDSTYQTCEQWCSEHACI